MEDSTGFVTAVREVPMIPAGYGEHPKEEKADAKRHGRCCCAGDENQEAGELNTDVETGRENLTEADRALRMFRFPCHLILHRAPPQ